MIEIKNLNKTFKTEVGTVEALKNINFTEYSFASCILPAPSLLPKIMEIALPIAIMPTLKRLEIIWDIFKAPTTARPLTE